MLDNSAPVLLDKKALHAHQHEDAQVLRPFVVPDPFDIVLRSRSTDPVLHQHLDVRSQQSSGLRVDLLNAFVSSITPKSPNEGGDNPNDPSNTPYKEILDQLEADSVHNPTGLVEHPSDVLLTDSDGPSLPRIVVLEQELRMFPLPEPQPNAPGVDRLNQTEVFSWIRDLRDPEYMDTTLEQLSVVTKGQINVDHELKLVDIRFTPTVPHCSQATVIGLSIRIKFVLCLGNSPYRLRVAVEPGSHVHDTQITKQINDKERIRAAMESPNVRRVVLKALRGSFVTTNDDHRLWHW